MAVTHVPSEDAADDRVRLIIFQSSRHIRNLKRPICRRSGLCDDPLTLSLSLTDNVRKALSLPYIAGMKTAPGGWVTLPRQLGPSPRVGASCCRRR